MNEHTSTTRSSRDTMGCSMKRNRRDDSAWPYKATLRKAFPPGALLILSFLYIYQMQARNTSQTKYCQGTYPPLVISINASTHLSNCLSPLSGTRTRVSPHRLRGKSASMFLSQPQVVVDEPHRFPPEKIVCPAEPTEVEGRIPGFAREARAN